MSNLLRTFFLIIGLCLLQHSLVAQQLPFQGRLLLNGLPFTGQQTFAFSINSGGISWAETHTNVTVANGLYVVILGSVTPLPDSLYKNTISHPLYVSVQGNPLDTVMIYAPFERDPGVPAYLKDGVDWTEIQDIPVNLDTSQSNEIQNLSLMGDTLSISQGNYVVIQSQTDSLVVGQNLTVGDPDTTVQFTLEQNSGNNTQGFTSIWQSFAAPTDGEMTAVEVKFAKNLTTNIQLKVYTGTGNATQAIYLGTYVDAQFSAANVFQRFDINNPTPITLNAGDVYTFEVIALTANALTFDYNDQNVYPYGQSSQGANFDLVFKIEQAVVNGSNLAVSSNGNVGIGTNSPSAALEVNGRIKDKTGFVMPVGSIIPYAGSTPPEGWLFCDGTEISRFKYSDLFTAIGTNWGEGNSSTTFNLPELRGAFLRGWRELAPVSYDPDATSRVNISGTVIGNVVGSFQGNATAMPINPFSTLTNGDHWHYVLSGAAGQSVGDYPTRDGFWGNDSDYSFRFTFTPSNVGRSSNTGGHTHQIVGGDSESRPRNAAVMYIIKY